MFIQKRVIKGVEYKYLDHSFRLGAKVHKVSLLLDKSRQDYNEQVIRKIAAARATYFKELGHIFFSEQEITEIETEKLFFQLFYDTLEPKQKQEILDEFIRLFLANSMELEGSTITPQLAENIDRKKKIILPESEVTLYQNSRKALQRLWGAEFRSVILFKRLHKEIYEGIFAHAGEWKSLPNTFGYTEKAQTTAPEQVKRELKMVLDNYKNKETYPFLKPLLFHMHYQKIHPFHDGNSRLGRILLAAQMFKLSYPPFIFKGDMSFQIRETLIEYINHKHWDFCRLGYEQYLQTAKKFWRPMIRRYMF